MYVQDTPNTGCSKYRVFQIQGVPNTGCSKYRLLQIQGVPNTGCSKYRVFQIQGAPNTLIYRRGAQFNKKKGCPFLYLFHFVLLNTVSCYIWI